MIYNSNYKNLNVRPHAITRDYIWVKENSLTRYFCNKVIKKFDEESSKVDGRIGEEGRVDKNVKDTKDFTLSRNENWKKEDTIFYTALQKGLKEYLTYLHSIHYNNLPNLRHNTRDTGYKLQRYEPGGFYDWHNDWTMNQKNGSRVYVFMWYLNSIRKKDGGYTEFIDGTRLQPKCGSLVFFPATWTYLHRGYPPKVRKYLCNGWIYAKP